MTRLVCALGAALAAAYAAGETTVAPDGTGGFSARCTRWAVRACWLARHVARELGTATVARVTAAGGSPHRLRIDWSTGMTVFVNHAADDWACATGDEGLGTVVLPPYGFVAFNARTDRYAAIRRRGGRVVEESAYSEGQRVVRYVNPRGEADARRPASPVDYGWVKTAEAFRLVSEPGKPDVKTPLPAVRAAEDARRKQ